MCVRCSRSCVTVRVFGLEAFEQNYREMGGFELAIIRLKAARLTHYTNLSDDFKLFYLCYRRETNVLDPIAQRWSHQTIYRRRHLASLTNEANQNA